jgi:hypothetical protein
MEDFRLPTDTCGMMLYWIRWLDNNSVVPYFEALLIAFSVKTMALAKCQCDTMLMESFLSFVLSDVVEQFF